MKITAPLDTVNEAEILIKAGADELYCGVYHNMWKEIDTFPNARHMFYGNLKSFKDLKDTLCITKKYAIPLYLCVNEYYSKKAYALIRDDIDLAFEAGIDGFIVADVSLISIIRKRNSLCKIILSSLTPSFNAMGFSFFKELGVDRVILPLSQLSLQEIIELAEDGKKMGMEVEVFINNITCKNINGFCLYHNVGIETYFNSKYATRYRLMLDVLRNMIQFFPSSFKDIIGKALWRSKVHPSLACRKEYDVRIIKKENGNAIEKAMLKEITLERDFAQRYCILCALYFFAKRGVVAGKIAGRGSFTGKKVRDIQCAKRYLTEIEHGIISEHNFSQRGRRIYQQNYGIDCKEKNCSFLSSLQTVQNISG